MNLDKAYLEGKIKELEAQREQVVSQVNQMLGEIAGKISVYQEFLKEEEGVKEEVSNE